ncbi:MAG: uncharacterized protein KVP18_001675 [Porospora cf. gigantea A]|uniref:uncharacterized protein n=1 Tax=Porospora cf. gigantea A TaxID=2853593 RepID=UPI00355994C4|nr:MAG: hypothetical protein KVP18_001675 [Porospora cf. gigantea A]
MHLPPILGSRTKPRVLYRRSEYLPASLSNTYTLKDAERLPVPENEPIGSVPPEMGMPESASVDLGLGQLEAFRMDALTLLQTFRSKWRISGKPDAHLGYFAYLQGVYVSRSMSQTLVMGEQEVISHRKRVFAGLVCQEIRKPELLTSTYGVSVTDAAEVRLHRVGAVGLLVLMAATARLLECTMQRRPMLVVPEDEPILLSFDTLKSLRLLAQECEVEGVFPELRQLIRLLLWHYLPIALPAAFHTKLTTSAAYEELSHIFPFKKQYRGRTPVTISLSEGQDSPLVDPRGRPFVPRQDDYCFTDDHPVNFVHPLPRRQKPAVDNLILQNRLRAFECVIQLLREKRKPKIPVPPDCSLSRSCWGEHPTYSCEADVTSDSPSSQNSPVSISKKS